MESGMSKITHTEAPMITFTGFIPDENTRRNDEYFRKMQAWKQARREQTLELLMLLSAWSHGHSLPITDCRKCWQHGWMQQCIF